jgi:YrbI family 3-deoxy-D-manno-octulosonate 8-phosphate phosphatase
MNYKRFILDVDGVFNDGKIYWSATGKLFKAFSNYDHDGLKFLRQYIPIECISADRAGWEITKSRIVDHMKIPLTLVSEHERLEWVKSQGNLSDTIYMGDGPHDAKILREVGLGIAPAQAWESCKKYADYITTRAGGEGAVIEACVYILNKMEIKHEF